MFKTEVVLMMINGARLIRDVAEVYGVHPRTDSNWRREYFDNAEKPFSTDEEIKKKDRKIEELKQQRNDEKLRREKARGFLSGS